jgi:membrane associated rhomboid family serine protease
MKIRKKEFGVGLGLLSILFGLLGYLVARFWNYDIGFVLVVIGAILMILGFLVDMKVRPERYGKR